MIAPAMIAGVMVLIAVSAALFVLAPLRRQGAPPAEPGVDWERLALERSGAAQALRDLELDRATGKLSDADYDELAARYRTRALGVLRRLEALPPQAAASTGGAGAGERRSSSPEEQEAGRGGGEAG